MTYIGAALAWGVLACIAAPFIGRFIAGRTDLSEGVPLSKPDTGNVRSGAAEDGWQQTAYGDHPLVPTFSAPFHEAHNGD